MQAMKKGKKQKIRRITRTILLCEELVEKKWHGVGVEVAGGQAVAWGLSFRSFSQNQLLKGAVPNVFMLGPPRS